MAAWDPGVAWAPASTAAMGQVQPGTGLKLLPLGKGLDYRVLQLAALEEKAKNAGGALDLGLLWPGCWH